MSVRSKLPQQGTTIFTVMSRRAAELGAINLGQGFPDYDIDPRLAALVHESMQQGFNQYAPMPGLPLLREQIALKLQRDYGLSFDPEREITITLGATEGIYSAVQALVGPGDEAIVFDPAYDSYEPAITLAGARCIHVPLLPPTFEYDWERVRAAISARTRLLILNTPHNPSCTLMQASDLVALAQLLRGHDIRMVSDEVYEHVVFDAHTHNSVLSHEELRARSVAVFSFGKVLHATGVRVGYTIAPAALTTEVRKVHQFNTFTIATCLQQAIARYLIEHPDCGRDLRAFFAAKRDRLTGLLRQGGLKTYAAAGTYFQLLDYGDICDAIDLEFCEELLTQAGVATIPLSVFYQEPPPMTLLRLCFAKREETLVQGADRLCRYAQRRTRSGELA